MCDTIKPALRPRRRFAAFGVFRDTSRLTRERAEARFIDESDMRGLGIRSLQDARSHRRDDARRGDGYRATDWTGALVPVVARIGTARDVTLREYAGWNERERRATYRDVTRRGGYWIAGYLESDSGGYVFDTSRVFPYVADEACEDAERAAHDMAQRAAEKESEWHAAWSEGRDAAQALEDARAALADAVTLARQSRESMRESIRLARALARGVKLGMAPGLWRKPMRDARTLRDMRNGNATEAREAWHAACDAFEDAAPSKWCDTRDAWCDGAGESDSILACRIVARLES